MSMRRQWVSEIQVKVRKGSRDPPRGVEKIATVHFLLPDILKKQNPPVTEFGRQIPTE